MADTSPTVRVVPESCAHTTCLADPKPDMKAHRAAKHPKDKRKLCQDKSLTIHSDMK